MAHATAQVTLKIECSSNWDEDTPISQIRKQAIEDAEYIINEVINDHGSLALIGPIKITTVTQDV